MQKRAQKIFELIENIGYSLKDDKFKQHEEKLLLLMKELTFSIQDTSKTEIDVISKLYKRNNKNNNNAVFLHQLSCKTREYEKRNFEYLALQIKYEKLSERSKESTKKTQMLEEHISNLKIENNRLNQTITRDQKIKSETESKIQNLEQRIEFLLESDLNIVNNSQDKLRKCLAELMKELENKKRENENKNKEIQSLKQENKKLEFKLNRISKNINKEKEENNMMLENTSFFKKKGNDERNLSTKIPDDLGFRINSLKFEFSSKNFLLFICLFIIYYLSLLSANFLVFSFFICMSIL